MTIEISLELVFILLFVLVVVITNLMNWWFRKSDWSGNSTTAVTSAMWIIITVFLIGGMIGTIYQLL